MKTAVFVVLLALSVFAKEEEKKKEDGEKSEINKRGFLTPQVATTGIGTLNPFLIPEKTEILNGGHIFTGGGIGSTVLTGSSGGSIVTGGHQLCTEGLVHGGLHHIPFEGTFHKPQYIHTPSVHIPHVSPVVQTLKIEKPVPYPVPHPFNVHVDRPVPVPKHVPQPFNVDVPKPYPVHTVKEVPYDVIKHVPYEVEHRVPYSVKKLVPYQVVRKIPYPVHYPVDKPYPVHVPQPYPVTLTRRVPYLVDKHVPFPINVKVQVPVTHPVPVEVPRPYPVKVPHPVPVPVDRPYPVDVPKPVPVAVDHKIPVPVPHPVHVPVIKHIPFPVKSISDHHLLHGVTNHFEDSLLLTHPSSIIGTHVNGEILRPIQKFPVGFNLPFGNLPVIPPVDINVNKGADQKISILKVHHLPDIKVGPTVLPALTVPTLKHVVHGTSGDTLISADGVKYTNNGFTFGTSIDKTHFPLPSADVGTHGSFDLTHSDISHIFAASSPRPDISVAPSGFNVPLTVKASRASADGDKKPETPKPTKNEKDKEQSSDNSKKE